jgi:hypothetical protein
MGTPAIPNCSCPRTCEPVCVPDTLLLAEEVAVLEVDAVCSWIGSSTRRIASGEGDNEAVDCAILRA